MRHKYFYIIKNSGMVYEVRYSKSKLEATMRGWKDKGIIILKEDNVHTNGATISDVMTEEKYRNYILTTNPKQYIKHGTWYSRNGDVIKHEEWKQLYLEDKKKKALKPPEESKLTEEQLRKIESIKKEIRKKFNLKNKL